MQSRKDITKDEFSDLVTVFDHFIKQLEHAAGKETASTISFPSIPPVGKQYDTCIHNVHMFDFDNLLFIPPF